MTSQYRVVFKGKILEGFAESEVRSKAVSKLKTTPEQVERLFSGRSSVLKKGVSRELGERYVNELGRIGMQVSLEEIFSAPDPAMQVKLPPQAPPKMPPAESPLASTDLEKTQLADPDALSRYLQESPDLASAPTLIVTPAHSQAIKAHIQAEIQAEDPAHAPTMIVSPASAPTIIVPPNKGNSASHDPERTLIANQDALDAYFKNNADPLAGSTASSLNVAAADPHKTELNPDALDAYLNGTPILNSALQEIVRSVPITIATEPEPVPIAAAPTPSPFSAPAINTTEHAAEEDEEPVQQAVHDHHHKYLRIAAVLAVLLALIWWFI